MCMKIIVKKLIFRRKIKILSSNKYINLKFKTDDRLINFNVQAYNT